MANDDFDWAAFVNFDPELHVPATGYDMQGAAAGEVAPGDVSNAPMSDACQAETELPSTGFHHSPIWLSPCHLDKRCSHHSADLAADYNNFHSPDPRNQALSLRYHDHPATHNRVVGEIAERNDGYSHGPNSADSGVGGFPTYMPPSSITSNPVVLHPPVNVRPNSPTNALNLKPCVCISCAGVGHNHRGTIVESRPYLEYPCRFPDCKVLEYSVKYIISHEHGHYREEGQYPCKEEHCNFTTKRWSDFKRHVGSKHCTSPVKRWSCPVLWCKYSGSNGFARKDKLNSHYRTVHAGKVGPGKANKVIKPKASGAV